MAAGLLGVDEHTALKAVTSTFLQYDQGAKGGLTRHELRAAYISLFGRQPSKVEMDMLLPKDINEVPQMELSTFCNVMIQKLCTQDADELIRRCFRAFDTECKGFISLSDLQTAMVDVAPHLAAATVALVFSQVDADGDGRVSYKDFHAMMCTRSAVGAR
uniref:EF-hand domain-containing protein n=1 Tax=Chrysotila carterae TaxID=13221 RepID=A0A7S4B5Y9_CHRCT|mmetsp:Transcript_55998/g.121907  ORF Transcript_55998/g.121907 Transcript_55998/m.121907 type:complete len:160 (+) Transcript_55998:92-571(+)